jgi:hypothetical protein
MIVKYKSCVFIKSLWVDPDPAFGGRTDQFLVRESRSLIWTVIPINRDFASLNKGCPYCILFTHGLSSRAIL